MPNSTSTSIDPGVWIMGDLADDDRGHGMGIVVEYANGRGKPQWSKPEPYKWDYTIFGSPNVTPPPPDEAFEVTVVKHNGAQRFQRMAA